MGVFCVRLRHRGAVPASHQDKYFSINMASDAQENDKRTCPHIDGTFL